MRIIVITIFLLMAAFIFFMKYLTYSRRNDPLPDNVRDVYDEETYKKNQAYKMDNLKFSIIVGSVGIIITLCFLFFNFHHRVYEFITQQTGNFYILSLCVLIIPLLIESAVSRLMSIYSTFVIEKRYEFNKTTPVCSFGRIQPPPVS